MSDDRPRQGPFASTEEVARYLGGDEIACLVCGKGYRRLGFHLSSAHGLSSNEYKVKFGLPADCVLDCPSVRERLSATALENWQDPKIRERTNAARAKALADPAVPGRMSEGMNRVWKRDGCREKWAEARWGDPNFRARQTPKKKSWRVARARRSAAMSEAHGHRAADR